MRPENPRGWIYTVAANLVRDEGRRAAVRKRHLRLVMAEAAQVPPAAPDEEIARERRRRRIVEALDTLAERDRKALLLKEEGCSYEEIATRLGLSTRSVGTTLARARARLAAAWEGLAGDGGREDVAR